MAIAADFGKVYTVGAGSNFIFFYIKWI
jgi:hypothetical protein